MFQGYFVNVFIYILLVYVLSSTQIIDMDLIDFFQFQTQRVFRFAYRVHILQQQQLHNAITVMMYCSLQSDLSQVTTNHRSHTCFNTYRCSKPGLHS